MDRTYAFVDESGNSDLDTSKGGSSGFFIVCSILVAEKDLEAAYAHPDEDERLQLSILRFLRFQSEFVTKDYVLTTEIMAHLKDSGLGEVNGQRIRSSGIAKLRDADVIITSAAKGYKIPQTRADINDFLERASGIVVPLLERVKKARDVYRLSSRGEYDIVTANLAELAKLLAALDAFADDLDMPPTQVTLEQQMNAKSPLM